MREAMARADVGDDQYGEDPTANRLQERVAELLDKETSLWLPSGTMANQVALRVLTRPGDDVVVSRECHALWHETGGASANAGVQLTEIGTDTGLSYFAAEGSPEQYVIRLRQSGDKRLDLIAFGAQDRAAVDNLAAHLGSTGVQLVGEPDELQTAGGGYGFRFFDIDGRTIRVDKAYLSPPADGESKPSTPTIYDIRVPLPNPTAYHIHKYATSKSHLADLQSIVRTDDDLALLVEKRAAGVAGVERRVELDAVGILEERAGRVLVAVDAAHDPVRNGGREIGGEQEGVPDHINPFADGKGVAVA